jgi:pyridoxine 5-phosphate synthase
MPQSVLLGVNIDHVATLRQARGTPYPDPLLAALLSEQAGADGITVHLREDRRHIQEADVVKLQQSIHTRLNLEIALTEPMLQFAEKLLPAYVCLVPEKREELTTEGGLDVVTHKARIIAACKRLRAVGIAASLFIDADERQVEAAAECQAPIIELHTGRYADALTAEEQQQQLQCLTDQSAYAQSLGLQVNAGHGLTCHNVQAIARIPGIVELNIGHSIVADALFVGLPAAVSRIKAIIQAA